MLTYEVSIICDDPKCEERDTFHRDRSIISTGPMASVSMESIIAYAKAQGWQVILTQSGEPRFACLRCQQPEN